MSHKDKKHYRPATHPANTADLDKTETGPSRLFAPGKPREVEAGPSRLRPAALLDQQTHASHGVTRTESQDAVPIDSTEAGAARIIRHRG